jgi:chromosome segregation ATPase
LQADVGWIEQELNEVRGDCRVLKEERDEAREKLESSAYVINELREELLKVRSQLEQECADREEVEAQLTDREKVQTGFDDSVYDALVDVESAKKSAAVFGFTADEALADACFQINMLTSNYDELEDRYETLKRKHEESEAELSDLKQKSATASQDLPDAGDLLNRLMAKYEKMKAEGKKPKKPTASLADIEGILEMIEES